MDSANPVFWPIAKLIAGFADGSVSPVEVTTSALERIDTYDPLLHSYLTVTADLAVEQAKAAQDGYRRGLSEGQPLLGVPLSIKDLFDVRGETTTLGSRAVSRHAARKDSQAVRLLRQAGGVFLGKSNTAEFGQSATTGNLLGPDCGNPWDPDRTSGGSSGGAAASVGAGLATAALGSDGGGSIRIPAAMCGLFGVKPTFAGTPEHDSFHAMTHFVCSGPISRDVADARILLSVLLERQLPRGLPTSARVGWCPSPLDRPVEPGVRLATARAVDLISTLGHYVEQIQLPLDGWADAFGPLVLADEWQFRRHLLEDAAGSLTTYVRKGIEAGATLTTADVDQALRMKTLIQQRVAALFEQYDLLVTPTTACTAFPIDARPTMIDGFKVDPLWGPFPFTAPFNVSGNPAASIPVGLSSGLPVGLQVIAAHGAEAMLLDFCEDLEEALAFPKAEMERRWSGLHSPASL